MPKTSTPARGGEAGYATLARILTAFYVIDPPLESRQVHMWSRRGTKNRSGDPFPDPVREVENPRRGQPRYLFSPLAVLAWYYAGVPDLHGKGWRVPEPLSPEVQHLLARGLDGNTPAP